MKLSIKTASLYKSSIKMISNRDTKVQLLKQEKANTITAGMHQIQQQSFLRFLSWPLE